MAQRMALGLDYTWHIPGRIACDSLSRRKAWGLLLSGLMEVARYLSRDVGVMSRGLCQLEDRLQKDRTFHKRSGIIQVLI